MLDRWKKERVNWYSNPKSVSTLLYSKSLISKILIFKCAKIKVCYSFNIFSLWLSHSLVSKILRADFASFPYSIIALNKQHDIQYLYLIKITSKSKMQTTAADAMVNHPNAWFSWLKPAAAIEATISTRTDGARTLRLLSSLSPSLSLPPPFLPLHLWQSHCAWKC